MVSSAFWDWSITILVLGGFLLIILAKVTKKTIPELMGDLREAINNTRGDSVEYVANDMLKQPI